MRCRRRRGRLRQAFPSRGGLPGTAMRGGLKPPSTRRCQCAVTSKLKVVDYPPPPNPLRRECLHEMRRAIMLPRALCASRRAHLRFFSSQAPRDPLLTVPNALTVLRMAMSPFLGVAVMRGEWDAAATGFAFAAALDVADGAIARAWPSQASKIGSYLDPVADKLLMGCVAIPLAAVYALPPEVVALWVSRDVGLVAGGFYVRAITRPPGVRFFERDDSATPHVKASMLSKVNTAVQVALVIWALGAHTSAGVALPVTMGAPFTALAAVSAATTVLSGATYFRQAQAAIRAARIRGS